MFGKFPEHDHKNWTPPWIFCCDFYPKVAKFAIREAPETPAQCFPC